MLLLFVWNLELCSNNVRFSRGKCHPAVSFHPRPGISVLWHKVQRLLPAAERWLVVCFCCNLVDGISFCCLEYSEKRLGLMIYTFCTFRTELSLCITSFRIKRGQGMFYINLKHKALSTWDPRYRAHVVSGSKVGVHRKQLANV